MTDSLPALAGLPTTRPTGCPFDPPTELARLREQRPLTRMSYPDGHLGWLVTSHELVRAVLADPRFSSRSELMHSPAPGAAAMERPPVAPPGMFIAVDPPEHTRYRRLLAGRFTVRRMRQLTARVEEITAEQLDAMERQGPPVDLVQAYAQPIPALMICELLGVPYADREFFRQHSATVINQAATKEEQGAAIGAIGGFLHELVLAKRAEPTDDLLSDLTTSDLSDEELTNIAMLLLVAGLGSTADMLGLGAFALLRHPDQLTALRTDPTITDQAVEELLRYLSITHTRTRTALEDVKLDDQLIRAGETVTLSFQAANRDPGRFADPDTLDLRRQATGHLALGHGIHQCLGQQLARVEMRVAYPALVTRFPTLRLAVPPEDVPLRGNADIAGVDRLPVTWEGA
ncbi:cytochrome P450 [Kitasatospora sp. NPDC052896]|uniref:cytochrome P450 n=1 Tax=Kitasatospora sp. NPDC052896 TaxID=3364061 RepID=UPI0037C82B1B